MRSRKQAAIKTPPEKQEQRLMKVSHLLLEAWLVLSRSLEKNLNGRTPPRKVMSAMTIIVAIFSLNRLEDSILG